MKIKFHREEISECWRRFKKVLAKIFQNSLDDFYYYKYKTFF